MRTVFGDGVLVLNKERNPAVVELTEPDTKETRILGLAKGDCRDDTDNLYGDPSPSGRLIFRRTIGDDVIKAHRQWVIPADAYVSKNAATHIQVYKTDDSTVLLIDLNDVRSSKIALRYGDQVCIIDCETCSIAEKFAQPEEYDLYLCDYTEKGLPVPIWKNGSYDFKQGDWVPVAHQISEQDCLMQRRSTQTPLFEDSTNTGS